MRLFFVIAALYIPLSGPALAAEPNFNYTYVDVEYRQITFGRYDGDGFRIEGAYAFADNYFLFGRLVKDTADTSFQGSSLYPQMPPNTGYNILNRNVLIEGSVEDFAFGAGMVWPLGDAVEVSGRLFYTIIDGSEEYSGTYEIVEGDGTLVQAGPLCGFTMCTPTEFDDSGFGLAAGIRGAVTDWFELFGNVSYIDVDLPAADDSFDYVGSVSDTTIEVGARFSVTERLSVSLATSKHDELDSTQLGVRFEF